MNFRFALAAALSIIAAGVICSNVAQAAPEMCRRLKEISSVDPDKILPFPGTTREERCRMSYWRHLQPLPLSEILNEAETARYDETLAKQNCDAASAFLSKRFVETHPNVPSILENKSDYRSWERSTAANHFPKLWLCFNLKVIREAHREIDRLGLLAEPYAGHKKSILSGPIKDLPPPIYRRHGAVSNIVILVRPDFEPTMALALLKLSLEGKVVKHHELMELYLAYRLHYSGLRDPIIQQVIDRPLDSKLKAKIEQKAKLKLYPYDIPQYPD